MTSYVRTLALLALTPSLLAGSEPSNPVPPELEQEVAMGVAEVWGVSASLLQLEWGQLPTGLDGTAKLVRLGGRGRGGWFVALLARDGGETAVRVRAGFADTAWVAAHALASGDRIGEDDMRPEPRIRWGTVAARTERPEPGWLVRRAVLPGAELAWPAVVPPVLVEAGEPVRMEWTRGGVTVVLTGRAINSARRGETVRARVDGRTEPVAGTAVAPGVAELMTGGL